MGIRYGMVFDLFGAGDYFAQIFLQADKGSTWPNAAGLVILLAQPKSVAAAAALSRSSRICSSE
jgi:hypothetical protein